MVRRFQKCDRIVLAVFIVALSSLLVQNAVFASGKKPKSSSLSVAVGKVNKSFLHGRTELDKQTIEDSGLFEGRLRVGPEILHRDSQEDGTQILDARFPIRIKGRRAFVSADERLAIRDAVSFVDKAKADRITNVARFKQLWERRYNKTRGPIQGSEKDGWFHKHSPAWIPDAEYKQRLNTVQFESDNAVKDAEDALRAVRDPIDARVEAVMESERWVQARIIVKPEEAEKIDWAKFMRGRPTIYVKVLDVRSFDNSEVHGGTHHISEMLLGLVDCHKRLEKEEEK